ncbi:MAG: IS1595 family transposase [Blastocatellia bacterium]
MKIEQEQFPKTLLEAIKYFANPDNALDFMIMLRWPDGKPICPLCSSTESSFISTRRIWKCKGCKKQFTVKLGTIMEDSPIGLDKWLCAIWMIVNDKNGISSYEVARGLGITQKSGWFLLHRIRLAMQDGSFEKMSGQVEADETFIGGKARFMHKHKRVEKITGTGGAGKVIVMGLLERHGNGNSRVRTKVVSNRDAQTLQGEIRTHVDSGSQVMTDELTSYKGLDDYAHNVINHAEKYVNGHVHTNGIENFWSLMKRCLKGTYVSCEPFHLFRYLDEESFRFNNRKVNDQVRFLMASAQIVDRRLTYKKLTGKDTETLTRPDGEATI